MYRTLREKRHKRKLSIRQAADAISELNGERFGHVYLWELEAGKADNPTLRVARLLSRFYDTPIEQLFPESEGFE